MTKGRVLLSAVVNRAIANGSPVIKEQTATRWIVLFGACTATFYTQHHAEQFMRALRLDGTDCRMEVR